jgi:glycyl-tRNA synthetase beta chain
MGLVTISFRHGFDYDVRELAAAAYDLLAHFPNLAPKPQVVEQATEFIMERLLRFLMDMEIPRDAVEAVMPASGTFSEVRKRAVSLESMRRGDGWEDLVTAFTRPSNLAKKLPPDSAGEGVDPALFGAPVEGELFQAWRAADAAAKDAARGQDYLEAFRALAGLRPLVDRYFDEVLVMTEEEAVRLNRLRLLAGIAKSVRRLAHLDRLQG